MIVGNWKMNPTTKEEARRIFVAIKKTASKASNILTVICPPLPYISIIGRQVLTYPLALGAQNVHHEYSGGFTGEVGASMLGSVGVSYVIIGHSERRQSGESDEVVAQKCVTSLKAGLNVILCIGEKEHDTQGNYLDFLKNQIKTSLYKVERRFIKNVIIAYEPIWAIGGKISMASADIYEMTIFIKKVLSDIYGQEDAMKTKILYGGSVNFRDAKEIIVTGKVDGLLVGRESVNPEGFVEIIKTVDEIN